MNKNIFSLNDKVALVTGSSRGNGKAIAEGFVEAGAKVIGLDIKDGQSKILDNRVCDITNSQDLHNCIKSIINKYDKVDILVNNAGVSYPESFLDYPNDSWNKTYQVNLKAPFELIKAISKFMIKTGGSIINITSLNAELAFPNNPAYVAFKGALKQLTKSAALDLGKYNIRVNNIGPGYFTTEMTKVGWQDPKTYKERSDKTVLGRWGEPKDLVGVSVFLASQASSYITGQDIYVDGGWSIKGL